MSAAIITAISRLPQLRNSLFTTAARLAYFANVQGIVSQKSYTTLARDQHTTPRTMMRRMARLEAQGVLRKEVRWLGPKRCAINVYRFLVGLPQPLHGCASDKPLPTTPSREKKSVAQGLLSRPSTPEELLQGCRAVLARLGLAVRSP